MRDLDLYNRYYIDQAGSGLNVFRGASFQRGHGVGSFLKGLFRSALPLFKSGARAIGHEALKTGANILSDISHNRPVRQTIRHRVREAGQHLTRKADAKLNMMQGNGLKARKRTLDSHSSLRAKRVKTSRRKKKKRIVSKKKKKKTSKKSKSKRVTKRKKKRVVSTRVVPSIRDIFA